jgi:hypothetical protein
MPRFFLHLHNSHGFLEDEEGRDLASLADARDEAVRSIRSLLAEEIRRGRIDLRGRLDIAGEDGEILAGVAFGEAVEVLSEGPGA